MSIRNAAGAVQSKTAVLAMFTDVTPDENKVYRFDNAAALYKAVAYDGESTFEAHKSLRFVPGASYRYNEILAEFPDATFDEAYKTAAGAGTGIDDLAAAGGEAITIKGTNLDGVTSVTFGGTAATSVVVVDTTTVTCVSPAKTAGAHALVIVDDATPTLSGGNATYV